MKALVYTKPGTLEFQTVDDIQLQNDEILVNIDSVGVCGSDMHAFLGHDERRIAPLILGHEAAGIVTGGEQDGRRVTINPLVTCGSCHYCKSGRDNLCPHRQIISMAPRQGAFAEYVAMPARNLVTVPDAISLEKASLAEPIACGWHAVSVAGRSLTMPLSDIKALVIGGGPIGVGAALSLYANGARNIMVCEPNPKRRAFLQEYQEFKIVPPLEHVEASFDLVIDGVGFAGTRAAASSLAAPGGVIAHIGLGDNKGGLDTRRLTLQEITFIGTYTYTADDFVNTCKAIFNHQLGDLEWIEQRRLDEGQQVFSEIRAGENGAPKIVLKP